MIVATILAKNEEDIIKYTLEHHICQGIKYFIITDNDSTDRTKEIISKYPEVKEIIDEPENTHHQSKWVTNMARLACKLNPDWIVHLDADELWSGFDCLKSTTNNVMASEKVYFHPPVEQFSLYNMRFYLSFDHIPMPQECKIIHRPDPNIVITHGNHAVEGVKAESCSVIRHHYPIRSLKQWESKAKGHLALQKRGAICKRWELWHSLIDQMPQKYKEITDLWQRLVVNNNQQDLLKILKIWSTDEVLELFERNNWLPEINQWHPFSDVPLIF